MISFLYLNEDYGCLWWIDLLLGIPQDSFVKLGAMKSISEIKDSELCFPLETPQPTRFGIILFC